MTNTPACIAISKTVIMGKRLDPILLAEVSEMLALTIRHYRENPECLNVRMRTTMWTEHHVDLHFSERPQGALKVIRFHYDPDSLLNPWPQDGAIELVDAAEEIFPCLRIDQETGQIADWLPLTPEELISEGATWNAIDHSAKPAARLRYPTPWTRASIFALPHEGAMTGFQTNIMTNEERRIEPILRHAVIVSYEDERLVFTPLERMFVQRDADPIQKMRAIGAWKEFCQKSE